MANKCNFLSHEKNILLFLGSFLFISCGNKRIEITSEYIINENWNKQANAITINQMQIKRDSVIDFAHLNQVDIVNRLQENPSFRYYATVRINEDGTYKNRKIYFNKDNGFTWLDDVTGEHTNIVGNLQKGNWYKFSNLVTYPYFIYIYIDSLNILHRYDVNLANY